MAQRDWKFHDYDMRFNRPVKVHRDVIRYPVVYRLTHAAPGCLCLVCGDGQENSQWLRKTINGNGKGSTRYYTYASLDDALFAGIVWARGKDEEYAAEQRERAA